MFLLQKNSLGSLPFNLSEKLKEHVSSSKEKNAKIKLEN